MPITKYKDTAVAGPVDCSAKADLAKLKDKSVIVTGGASGLGEEYVRAFAKAGAYVTLADFNAELGQKIADEFPNVQFSKCDVLSWAEQLATFKLAIANSPHKSVDIVIANAGISLDDGVAKLDDLSKDPTEPNLRITHVNIGGVLLTTKLALHYFRVNEESDDRDRCLILKASLAGYLDLPGAPQYQVSKYGVRGLMHSMRRLNTSIGIRVNVVCPWVIETPIITKEFVDNLKAANFPIASKVDAGNCMLKIASDKAINGRAFGVVPHEYGAEGFVDLVIDDYPEKSLLRTLEDLCIRNAETY